MPFGYVFGMRSPAAHAALQREAAAKRYRLSKLQISEVSAVDRAANPGARIVLTKGEAMDPISKALRMNERDLIAFAKTDAISKAELSQVIDDMAQQRRQRGETREIAYTKFITEDPLGRDLFATMRAASGRDHHQELAFQKFMKVDRSSADGREAEKPVRTYNQNDADIPGEDDDDADPLGGRNGFHLALEHMVTQRAGQKEYAGKSRAQIYDHIARYDPIGKELLRRAAHWDIMQNLKQQNAAAG